MSNVAEPTVEPTAATPETQCNPAGVTAQPAPVLGCTPETPVTPPSARPDGVSGTPLDPDRWCWPASSAMNSGEIDTMIGRIAHFTDLGLTANEAERLADKLVLRDRDGDDRRYCFECANLTGTRTRRCRNWRQAGVAVQASDAALGRDFTQRLQRCGGFDSLESTSTAPDTSREKQL